jgi:uncharacterized protein
MNLLERILQLLVILFVVRLIANALFGGRARQTRQAPPAAPAERVGGTLVRDPQCGTYLPQTRAIRVGSGSDAQYFCSATCRDAYRAAHTSVA